MNYTKWVSMWGNAMSIAEHHPESYAKDITLRYLVYAPFAGSALHFTFDNYCGREPVTITRATVGIAATPYPTNPGLSCPLQSETLCGITFNDSESTTLPIGESVLSDAISFTVPAGSTLCISIYLEDFTPMQSAVMITGPLSKAYFSLGDTTHEATLPLNTSKTTNWFYFLSNIDILTEQDNHAIICYGDSITAQAWPDYLTLRLREEGITNTAVIRRAASGTRILRQYECITYDSYGLKGTNRFHHEVPTEGADTLIIQQGINDIIHPVGIEINPFRPMSDLPTAEELIDGLKWYIEGAKALGYRVYLGTLLPIYGCAPTPHSVMICEMPSTIGFAGQRMPTVILILIWHSVISTIPPLSAMVSTAATTCIQVIPHTKRWLIPYRLTISIHASKQSGRR